MRRAIQRRPVKYAILIYGLQGDSTASGQAARTRGADSVYIVEAPSLTSAIDWATSRTDTRTSSIEVRPVAAHTELPTGKHKKRRQIWPVS
jgi:hypothetical protein